MGAVERPHALANTIKINYYLYIKKGLVMKTKDLLLIAMTALVLFSCENKEEHHNNYVPERYDMFAEIVKITDSEQLLFVVAEEVPVFTDTIYTSHGPILHGDSSEYKIRGIGGVYEELFLGTNPYIDLGDGYYLVDWKWGEFLYEPSNVLIDVKWEDVKNRQQVWPIETTLLASTFPCHHKYIMRKSIDDLLGIQPSATMDTLCKMSVDYARPWFIWRFNTLEDLMTEKTELESHDFHYLTLESYNAEVARQDSLQQVYAERLRQIIKEGALQELFGEKK